MPRASSRSSLVACASSSMLASSSSAAAAGSASSLPRARLQVERQRDQPLLRAVVQVALEPAARGVAGLDDARARGAQLLDAGAQLGVEALVLELESRRAAAQQADEEAVGDGRHREPAQAKKRICSDSVLARGAGHDLHTRDQHHDARPR